MRHLEHDLQVAFFQWIDVVSKREPEIALFYAVPNAARRSPRQGKWLKAEGLRAGVPDVHLPVGRDCYHGLWIEFKVSKNKPTAEQKKWHEGLRKAGHVVEVCYSLEEAIRVTLEYLMLPECRLAKQ